MKLTKQITTTEEIEIEFPFYTKKDDGKYYCWLNQFRALEVINDKWERKISHIDYTSTVTPNQYALNYTSCSQWEFREALVKTLEEIYDISTSKELRDILEEKDCQPECFDKDELSDEEKEVRQNDLDDRDERTQSLKDKI